MLNSGCNHRQRYVLAACLDVNSAWLKLFALSKLKKKKNPFSRNKRASMELSMHPKLWVQEELAVCVLGRHSFLQHPPFPKSLSAFWLTSRLRLEKHWDLAESRVCGEADREETIDRRCIQNPVCWTCSTGLARLMRNHSLRCLMQVITASGRIQISFSSCVFSSREFLLIPGIFPLWWIGHNLGHVSVAAKLESAAAKCTHDWSTEGTKIPAAQGLEWNGAQKQKVGEMVQWEASGQRLQAGMTLWAKRSSSKWP